MKTIRRLTSILATAALAVASLTGIAFAAPKDVGPVTAGPYPPAANPLPAWYRDNSTAPFPKGIPLQPCLSQLKGTTGADMCVLLGDAHFTPLVPVSYAISADGLSLLPGFNFPSESFYVIADAVHDFTTTDPLAAKGSGLVVRAALEAAFLSDPPLPPTLTLFTRVRISLDAPRPGTYVVQHPYGTSTLTATLDAQGRMKRVVDVVDMPVAAVNPLAANPDPRSVSTFLRWTNLNDARLAVGTEKFIGDPNILAPVTGGPLRNNVIITGPGTNVTITNWSVAGQLFTFPPQVTLTPPASTDFGQLEMGLTSAPKTFNIANSADAPAQPLNVTAIGIDNPDFQLAPSAVNPCPAVRPFTVAVGTSCNFDVVFSPPRGGAPSIPSPPGVPRTGTLTVTTNAATNPTQTASLTGSALTPALQLTIAPSKPGPQVVLAPTDPANVVTFTATGNGPAVNGYEYQISQRTGTVWNVVQPWAAPAAGTSPKWDWTINGAAAGTYEIKVEMREAVVAPAVPGPPVAAASVLYTLVNFTFTATASASAPPGIPAVITATSNMPGLEYRFLLFNNNLWTQMQIGPTATWSWNTTGVAPGIYPITVEVRRTGTTTLMATKTLNYTVAGIPTAPTRVTLSASPASRQPRGTPVTFTATATGGTNVQYRFSISSNGGKTFTLIRDWNAARTFLWKTAASAVGKYQVKVDARSLGSTVLRTATVAYELR